MTEGVNNLISEQKDRVRSKALLQSAARDACREQQRSVFLGKKNPFSGEKKEERIGPEEQVKRVKVESNHYITQWDVLDATGEGKKRST